MDACTQTLCDSKNELIPAFFDRCEGEEEGVVVEHLTSFRLRSNGPVAHSLELVHRIDLNFLRISI